MTYPMTPDPVHPITPPRGPVVPPPVIGGAMHTALSYGPRAFHVPRTLRSWTIVMLAANVLMDVASIAIGAMAISFIQRAIDGEAVSQDEGATIDLVAGLVGGVAMLVYFATVPVFCCWFYRINANARLLSAEAPKVSPGLAVGSFFIPIMCLFTPCVAALASWRVSAQTVAAATGEQPAKATPVGTWWAAWIGANVLGQVVLRMTMHSAFSDEDPTLEQLLTENTASLLVSVVSIVSALLCTVVVMKLTGLQQRVETEIAKVGFGGR